MKNLYVVTLFRFKENYLMYAAELLKKLVIETRKELGCLQYDLIEDNEDKGVFFLIELWETPGHHVAHSGTEHLADFRRNSREMLLESTLVHKGNKIF